MLTGKLRNQVDKIWEAFWTGGITMQDGKVVTSGGRVLCVVALGDMVKHAQNRAYEIADGIKFDGCQMRRDIGYRAIGRK